MRLTVATGLAFALAMLWTVPLRGADASGGSDFVQAGDSVMAGRATFRQFCAACHGGDGRGHGPAAQFLLKDPTDLTHLRARNKGLFPRDALESMLLAPSRGAAPAGMSTMLVWGPIFESLETGPAQARARVEQLLTFLESIQED